MATSVEKCSARILHQNLKYQIIRSMDVTDDTQNTGGIISNVEEAQ